ncbi:ABC transporter permease [Litorilinea aerophila]|uniref:ABC transporter permease n=1 Tax=Litorilinea aerophila TaxID=1204385 RepID=A0A540VBR0_9CHLR|nr:ABC transporter permease [Litorilinea aerophila]MCC9077940.1 ABC transporter permease [Litorilinea aerophila]
MAEPAVVAPALGQEGATRRTAPRGFWQDTIHRLRRHRTGMVGATLVALLVLTALFGPYLAPYDPNQMDFSVRFSPPTLRHPLGADDFGRDILSRIMVGARVSLQVGMIAVGIAATVGTLLGLVAGYAGRVVDEVIMRAMDILFAFPAILLAIAILAALGKGILNAMVAIGVVYIPIFARIARGTVLAVRNEEFVEAARAIGARDARILFRHILPNALAPLIVETSLSLSFAILAEAALSFFGLGTQPPDPSWGRMLSEGRAYFQQSPWMGIFPGLAIMLSVMGFNFLGDGLRDVLDPRLKNL